MYLVEKKLNDESENYIYECNLNPFGPKFPKDLIEKSDRMEFWGSSFSDPGPDYCKFYLFKDEEIIAMKRTEGY